MSPEQTYLEHLATIERIAAFVARRNHLKPEEAAEFTQEVRVRMLDDDYAVIRKFERRSSFSTYLTTVILRLYHQYRVEQWGKWRPSAEAKRLGDKAITLERLLTRDRLTFDEAVKMLTTPAGSQYTVSELDAIYLRLPPRSPRPMLVSDEHAPEVAATDNDPGDRAESRDRERAAREVTTAIDRLIESLDAEDRLILQLRFWQALKVPDIAQRLHIEQKKIYKRLERLFGVMRRELEKAGVDKAEIGTLLCRGDQDLHFGAEIHGFRPSHPTGGADVRDNERDLR
ncbi:MAG TPA: sigma-70 family RNA polymerase sigma factor [Thermoanaerobaculia bacterium]|nr:sigma-70 family RNA polymerase sigma factor [Thermoanaerobaculia bacterium]